MFDITKKRAVDTAEIELVEADGSPLYDDKGNRLTVTICGPGTKTWQQADAERSRRKVVRVEKNRGKLSAAIDGADRDEIDFLVAVTVSFNGWEYPHPEKDGKWPSQRDMFHAAYSDDAIGYIRDHVSKEANDWSAFIGGSKSA